MTTYIGTPKMFKTFEVICKKCNSRNVTIETDGYGGDDDDVYCTEYVATDFFLTCLNCYHKEEQDFDWVEKGKIEMDKDIKLIDNFRIGFKDYIKRESKHKHRITEEEFISEYGIVNLKLSFLTNMLGLVTYSPSLDVDFGRDILEIMNIINKRENFEYIKDKHNYKKFIIVVNLLEKCSWVEWGTSIRGCWFSCYGSPEIFPRLDYYGMKKIVFDDEGNDIQEMLDYIIDESI